MPSAILGQWYPELSYAENIAPIDHHAYDVDLYAEDASGRPLGIAIFDGDALPLSKIHVFPYGGSGGFEVRSGSMKLF